MHHYVFGKNVKNTDPRSTAEIQTGNKKQKAQMNQQTRRRNPPPRV